MKVLTICMNKIDSLSALKFAQANQADLYVVTDNPRLKLTEFTYLIEKQETHEKYEQEYSQLGLKDEFKNESVFVFISTSKPISGLALRVLEELKENEITVVLTDVYSLSDQEKDELQRKVQRSVLQEYARSGLLKKILLFDENLVYNSLISKLGKVHQYSKECKEAISSLISDVLVSYEYFDSLDVEEGDIEASSVVCRIETLGVMELEAQTEYFFFRMTNPREKRYYVNLNEKEIDFQKLNFYNGMVKNSKNPIDATTKIMHGIWVSDGISYCILSYRTNHVQT